MSGGDRAETARSAYRRRVSARARLVARRRRAQEALVRAERFSLELGLAELDAQDRDALRLPDA